MEERISRISFIYALTDPISGNIRYIGKSLDPQARYKYHVRECQPKTYKEYWIASLRKLDLLPGLILLETNTEEFVDEREKFWIAEYRSRGFNLTNLTDGGDGFWGYKATPESIENRAKANRGKKRNSQEAIRLANLRKGIIHTENSRIKMGAVRKGKPRPDITLVLIGNKWNTGRKASEDTKLKMSNSHKGRKHSPETLEKMSLAQKKRSGEISTQMMGNTYAKGRIR